MVDHLLPKQYSHTDIIVTINGEPIPPFAWDAVRPKEAAIVGINVIPGKGGKNPLATILSIVAIVAAPYIAGAVTGAAISSGVIGTSLTAAQALYGAVRIGVGIIGFLASSMLSSTPSHSSAARNPKESPTQFITGATNQIDPYGVIPINLGTNRMFPKQAALPYTETVGNKQYARQLFTWGYGNVIIQNLQIGETAIANYDNVTMEHKLNSDLNDGTNLYANDVYQDNYSVVLANSAGYITRTTQEDTDEISVDITFSRGLTKYNNQGKRVQQTRTFELQYRETGSSGAWSTGEPGANFGANSIAVPAPPRYGSNKIYYILIMDVRSGALKLLDYSVTSGSTQPLSYYVPKVPDGWVRLASFNTRMTVVNPFTWVIENFTDDRSSSIPSIIATSSDFVPTVDGTSIDVSDGDMASVKWTVTAATAEPLRVSKTINFPARGQYDVRIKRLTADTNSDKILDEATWTAMRSITFQNPIEEENISGTAMRILGTDQLNGSVDRFNGIVSTIILDYHAATDTWLERVSSNPASLYRYVLQSPAFAKALPDSRINLEQLEIWHAYCESKGLTFNRVIDYETSIDDVLQDIAAAGMATKHNVDGVYGVLIDNERDEIRGIVNPRNSWGYSGNINYPEIPHALRVEFRNKDMGYNTDEVIVYADGYDRSNATLYERVSFMSCTDSDLAWYYGRMYLASIILQPETHKFSMDWENMTFDRGDRIQFVNDCILVGIGSGRIKSLIYDDPDTPTEIQGFVLDDVISVPSVSNFGVRVRHSDASGFDYYALSTSIGETSTITLSTPIEIVDDIEDVEAKWLKSLCNFTEFGKELDLIITDIKADKDKNASITAINYAPERFDATNGSIPPFSSNITIPLDLLQPNAPQLAGEILTDENVMTKNPDGTYVGRMVIPLVNTNEASVQPVVRFRYTGSTQWNLPNILVSSPTLVVLTGLDDGANYDIEIRFQRPGGKNLMSDALAINNQTYIGASTIPDDVENFKSVITDTTIFLEWDKNSEIDIDHYVLRFSSLYSGASYTAAQTLKEKVYENRISLPYQGGTYFVKAVDILGNESVNATAIITYDTSAIKNVVETLTEEPDFVGVKDNTVAFLDGLALEDVDASEGYYYFNDTVDLGGVYDCVLSAAVVANGIYKNNWFDTDDIFSLDDVFGAGDNDVFSMDDLFTESDIFGIGDDGWAVQLQYRVSQDGMTYGDWLEFSPGKVAGWSFQFRIYLSSIKQSVSPFVTKLEVTIDMPDRIERQEDLACDATTGAVVAYNGAFKNNPSVVITIQDGAADDRLDYVVKDETGFTVKVWNVTSAAYVDRILDYIASGYGRVQT